MRVVLCDDHRLFMEALAVVLPHKGFEVVGCTVDPQVAVDLVAAGAIDLCLLDLHFPRGDAFEAIAAIAASFPRTRIVVLSGSTDLSLLHRAVDAGAHGVAVKGERLESIMGVIERVLDGETVIQASLLRNAAGAVGAGPISAHRLARFLTAREREVLERLVLGADTARLAADLGVRYSTVRTHIQNILTKLGVHSKLEAVALAVHEGLVSVEQREPSSGTAGSGRRELV